MQSHRDTVDTQVYIWKTSAETANIGHAAIKVGADYLSIWPEKTPSFGPFTILPLKAKLAKTLEKDMETEGKHLSNLSDENGLPRVLPSDQTSAPPDFIYHIDDLNTEKMNEKIMEIKKEVATGQRRYQLFPAINVFRLFTESATYLNYNEVDIQKQRENARKREDFYKVNNCTTLVSEVLNAGGLFIKPTKSPMELTPNELNHQVRQYSLRNE